MNNSILVRHSIREGKETAQRLQDDNSPAHCLPLVSLSEKWKCYLEMFSIFKTNLNNFSVLAIKALALQASSVHSWHKWIFYQVEQDAIVAEISMSGTRITTFNIFTSCNHYNSSSGVKFLIKNKWTIILTQQQGKSGIFVYRAKWMFLVFEGP